MNMSWRSHASGNGPNDVVMGRWRCAPSDVDVVMGCWRCAPSGVLVTLGPRKTGKYGFYHDLCQAALAGEFTAGTPKGIQKSLASAISQNQKPAIEAVKVDAAVKVDVAVGESHEKRFRRMLTRFAQDPQNHDLLSLCFECDTDRIRRTCKSIKVCTRRLAPWRDTPPSRLSQQVFGSSEPSSHRNNRNRTSITRPPHRATSDRANSVRATSVRATVAATPNCIGPVAIWTTVDERMFQQTLDGIDDCVYGLLSQETYAQLKAAPKSYPTSRNHTHVIQPTHSNPPPVAPESFITAPCGRGARRTTIGCDALPANRMENWPDLGGQCRRISPTMVMENGPDLGGQLYRRMFPTMDALRRKLQKIVDREIPLSDFDRTIARCSFDDNDKLRRSALDQAFAYEDATDTGGLYMSNGRIGAMPMGVMPKTSTEAKNESQSTHKDATLCASDGMALPNLLESGTQGLDKTHCSDKRQGSDETEAKKEPENIKPVLQGRVFFKGEGLTIRTVDEVSNLIRAISRSDFGQRWADDDVSAAEATELKIRTTFGEVLPTGVERFLDEKHLHAAAPESTLLLDLGAANGKLLIQASSFSWLAPEF